MTAVAHEAPGEVFSRGTRTAPRPRPDARRAVVARKSGGSVGRPQQPLAPVSVGGPVARAAVEPRGCDDVAPRVQISRLEAPAARVPNAAASVGEVGGLRLTDRGLAVVMGLLGSLVLLGVVCIVATFFQVTGA